MRRPLLVLSLVLPLLANRAAQANPWELFGFSPRAIGLGGAYTALADDFTATFYNPAGLTVRRKVHFGLGLQTSISDLSIDRTKTDARPSEEAPNHTAITVGIVFPLGGKIDYRLALGIALNIPTNSFFKLQAIDPQTPQLYMYQSLPDKLVMAPALGVRITDFLSVGVGLQVLANLAGTAAFSADLVNRRFTDRNISVDLNPTAALTAGILIGPLAGFRFGACYRQSLSLSFHLPTQLNLNSIGSLDIAIDGIAGWVPDQLALGIAYELPSKKLRFAADLVYSRWSDAPDPATRVNLNATGDVIDRLGLGQALDLRSPVLPLGAVNTWSPHFGVEWSVNKDWALRGGYFFRPTPLPKQNGFTNYLDGDAHGFAIGFGWTYPDILELRGQPVTLELTFQTLYLPNRAAIKTLPNDPVGDLQSGGAMFTLALSFRHDF
jgi:long-chain fatty acid transport protein